MKREEVSELVQRGIRELNEALAAGKSDRLQQYLDVMARFPRYSFNNCMLIALQFPSARLIQGFHAWRKLGRTVKKGEKGIGIIAPMVGKKKDADGPSDEGGETAIFGFKIVHVFEVSQTEGENLPEFAQVSGDPGENIAAVESLIRSWGIELVYEEIPCGADGLSKKGTIVVAPDLEPAKRLLTLVHEASHERLHADSARRKETTKAIRETEAEAIAHVVCRALGLDTLEHCADYIQLYKGDAEVFAKSMDYIQKTASQILEGIKAHASKTSVESEELAALIEPQQIEVHPIVRQIIDRDCHVGESFRTVIRHVVSKLRGGHKTFRGMSKADRHLLMQQCVEQHRANRELYVAVMFPNYRPSENDKE